MQRILLKLHEPSNRPRHFNYSTPHWLQIFDMAMPLNCHVPVVLQVPGWALNMHLDSECASLASQQAKAGCAAAHGRTSTVPQCQPLLARNAQQMSIRGACFSPLISNYAAERSPFPFPKHNTHANIPKLKAQQQGQEIFGFWGSCSTSAFRLQHEKGQES